MDDLQLVTKRLSETALSGLDSIAEKTGIPVSTLVKIKYGATKNPRFSTVKPIADHFRAQEQVAA